MAGKALKQFEDEADMICRGYRSAWAASPNFRRGNQAPSSQLLSSSTTEAAAFNAELMKFVQERINTNPSCVDGVVKHLVQHYPGLLSGLAGLLAGLANSENLQRLSFDWEEASNASEKRSAVQTFVSSVLKNGIKCGLVDQIAWASMDVIVDYLMECDRVKCIIAPENWAYLKPLGALVVVKLLIDAVLYAMGWTTKHPLGKKNLVMTGCGLAASMAIAPLIQGSASMLLAMAAGAFITSYLDKLTTEWENSGKGLFRTLVDYNYELFKSNYETTKWIFGFSPGEGKQWIVPDNLARDIPGSMVCLITQELFMDPWLVHDMAFERRYLVRWIVDHGCHPLNVNVQVSLSELRPATELKDLCHEFARQHYLEWR